MPGTVTELPKKSRKKSPKEPEKPPETTEIFVKPSTGPFPPWPKGSGKGGFCKPSEMMDYWMSLPPEFIARTNFYVNREHPKLNHLAELPEEQREEIRQKKRKYPKKYIDKPGEPWDDLPDLRMAILRRYGSGDYKLFLNDCGVTTKEAREKKDPDLTSRNLCRCLVSFWDSEYPPILDPSRPDKGLGILDWSHPQNASYIADLRMKGVVPPNEKEEEMPNDVVKTLVDKVGTLADKVAVHEQDRLVERIAEKINPAGSQQQNTAGTIVEVMRAARELNAPPLSTEKSGMQNTLELVQTIMAMKADNPMADIYKLEMQSLREEMKAEREENRRLQREMREARPTETLETILGKAETLLPKFRDLLGLGGEQLTNVVRGRHRPWYEEVAIQAIPALAPGANALMGAIAQRFVIPGAIGTNANGQPQAQLPAGQQPPAPGSIQMLQMEVGQYLTINIKPVQTAFEHFLKHTPRDPDDPNEGAMDGTDLAQWIYDNHGEEPLKKARQLGSAQIVAMFKASQYWPALAQHEVKLGEFLDDLLAYKPEADEQDENGVTVAEDND